MTEVQIKDGRIVVNQKASEKKGNRPRKYRYSDTEFSYLLGIAKKSGLPCATKVESTKSVNTLTRAILGDFISRQQTAENKPKS